MIKYAVWLSNGAADYRKTAALTEIFGSPEEVYRARREDYAATGILTAFEIDALSEKSLEHAEYVLETCIKLGITAIALGDANYPIPLASIHAPPAVLYVRGNLNALSAEPCFAVVGTRGASPYGVKVAGNFAWSLAKSGLTIVSGLAEGIDAAAHLGALRADKPTIAVLGCGADVIYPAHNEPLYWDIVSGGAVVSEFEPETRPEGRNFPRRNRIISGLSAGVLIVESPIRSGALITASCALEQGRDVFAVPWRPDDVNGAGCLKLLREGAEPACAPGDIAEDYAEVYDLNPPPRERPESIPKPAPRPKERKRPEKPPPPPPEMTAKRRLIYGELYKGVKGADEIMRNTALPDVLAELTLMEIEGIIERTENGEFFITRKV